MAPMFFGAVFLLVIDQFIKRYALNEIGSDSVNLIGEILVFQLAKNEFIAFSLPLSGFPLLIINSGILVGLIVWIILSLKENKIKQAGSLTILAFGAISNMLDRIKYGAVIDYFDLKYFTVFNIADMMIVGGAALLIFFNIMNKKQPVI
jgi:signal peptidase II